ncbi:MAG: MerR family transcriptional regulator [Pyrinomonadaceae bacterium]
MALQDVVIPEKIYFKIGEVCELVGVQAHVLRYWETEFPMLSPQKNKSGQRSYRRRDVEIALRIKQLLYNEMFTIAGAKKKLQAEQREGNKPKVEAKAKAEPSSAGRVMAPTLFDTGFDDDVPPSAVNDGAQSFNGDQREAVKALATHLLELREMLKSSPIS